MQRGERRIFVDFSKIDTTRGFRLANKWSAAFYHKLCIFDRCAARIRHGSRVNATRRRRPRQNPRQDFSCARDGHVPARARTATRVEIIFLGVVELLGGKLNKK